MAYELIYTSVPQGIKPGSSGFCTVAYTNGLGASVVMLLEGISAYKPFFPHYDANASANPVSYIHYRYASMDKELHILSRICFYGLDYTKRSNKLAHHIILSDREITSNPAGPASVALSDALFLTEWNDDAQIFVSQKNIPSVEDVHGKASFWEKCAGDAGWAGVLAQSFLNHPLKPVYILFDPLKNKNTDNLNLIREALSLLPPAQRWKVTYNTYFTMLPAGMQCSWRFCVSTPETVKQLRHAAGVLVIDVTGPQPLNETGKLITAARTGQISFQKEAESFGKTQVQEKTAAIASDKKGIKQSDVSVKEKSRMEGKKSQERPASPLVPVGITVCFAAAIAVVLFLLTPMFKGNQKDRDIDNISFDDNEIFVDEDDAGQTEKQKEEEKKKTLEIAEKKEEAEKKIREAAVKKAEAEKAAGEAAEAKKKAEEAEMAAARKAEEEKIKAKAAEAKKKADDEAKKKAQAEAENNARRIVAERKKIWINEDIEVLKKRQGTFIFYLLPGEKISSVYLKGPKDSKSTECKTEDGVCVKKDAMGEKKLAEYQIESKKDSVTITTKKAEDNFIYIEKIVLSDDKGDKEIYFSFNPQKCFVPEESELLPVTISYNEKQGLSFKIDAAKFRPVDRKVMESGCPIVLDYGGTKVKIICDRENNDYTGKMQEKESPDIIRSKLASCQAKTRSLNGKIKTLNNLDFFENSKSDIRVAWRAYYTSAESLDLNGLLDRSAWSEAKTAVEKLRKEIDEKIEDAKKQMELRKEANEKKDFKKQIEILNKQNEVLPIIQEVILATLNTKGEANLIAALKDVKHSTLLKILDKDKLKLKDFKELEGIYKNEKGDLSIHNLIRKYEDEAAKELSLLYSELIKEKATLCYCRDKEKKKYCELRKIELSMERKEEEND